MVKNILKAIPNTPKLSNMMPSERSTAIKARESWHVLGIIAEFVEATEALVRPEVRAQRVAEARAQAMCGAIDVPRHARRLERRVVRTRRERHGAERRLERRGVGAGGGRAVEDGRHALQRGVHVEQGAQGVLCESRTYLAPARVGARALLGAELLDDVGERRAHARERVVCARDVGVLGERLDVRRVRAQARRQRDKVAVLGVDHLEEPLVQRMAVRAQLVEDGVHVLAVRARAQERVDVERALRRGRQQRVAGRERRGQRERRHRVGGVVVHVEAGRRRAAGLYRAACATERGPTAA